MTMATFRRWSTVSTAALTFQCRYATPHTFNALKKPMTAPFDIYTPVLDSETAFLLASMNGPSTLWVSVPSVEDVGEGLLKSAVAVPLKVHCAKHPPPTVEFVNVAHTTNPWLFEAYSAYKPKTEWCLPFPQTASAYLTRLAMKRRLASRYWVPPTFCDVYGFQGSEKSVAVKISGSFHTYINAEDTEDPALVEYFVKHPQRPVMLSSFNFVTGDAADTMIEKTRLAEQENKPATNIWSAQPLEKLQCFVYFRVQAEHRTCAAMMQCGVGQFAKMITHAGATCGTLAIDYLLLVDREAHFLSPKMKRLALARLQFLIPGTHYRSKCIVDLPPKGVKVNPRKYLFTCSEGKHYFSVDDRAAMVTLHKMLSERAKKLRQEWINNNKE